jgi:2-isopropylmalate synthase
MSEETHLGDFVEVYDTTLRDGTQGEGISFSADDKLMIARRLDELGIHYIEGGWPGSNPKDEEFFRRAGELHLKHARLAAFGSTRHPRNAIEDDPNVSSLLKANTPTVTLFGKSWRLHVERALGITLEENLKLISETVSYLKAHGREVISTPSTSSTGMPLTPTMRWESWKWPRRPVQTRLCCVTPMGAACPSLFRRRPRRPGGGSGCVWASMPTTIASWEWPTRWWRCWPAPPTSRAPSMATASAPVMPTCVR